MPSINAAIFHAYAYGTAFWYATRGACRVYDPIMVAGWFRPPSQLNLAPNDLELYNIRNDGWCLITLALILISLHNAIPLGSSPPTKLTSVPYAKAIVAATIFHHVTTAAGAYQHYKLETHYNKSMWIGVWVNAFLTVAGLVTWGSMSSEKGDASVEEVAKKIR